MELRQITYFLTLSEELHYRKAAEKLFISQPALSRQIKQMEEKLQLRLFERHNRSVKLTSSGQYLKKELSSINAHLTKAIVHAQLIHNGKEGKIKLGYIGSAMHKIIPNFLIELRKLFPNVIVDLEEMDNQIQIAQILDQDIDLGFVRMDRVPSGVEIKPLYEETFSLVLPIDHPISSSNFKSLSQLKNESFIMFDSAYSPSYYEKVMQIFDLAGFNPQISHKSVKANTIYRLVENNFGIAIVPTSLQEGYDLKIKFIELTDIPYKTTLQLIYSTSNQNPLMEKILALF